ncbi:hypothetical protein [Dokdonia sp. Hel_I_53]|uniref:hypothetical protein n=1 Tax=Dokdonia sp. Hel_I_53 TaxID=1566287 RepID=UPI001199BEA6|nr:hypothetical protein [Dokdonia sp. Hel_I_53]TVZ51862.1 hypothetical protein OD90_1021 [Dokdonia sp. Hel_I_53]
MAQDIRKMMKREQLVEGKIPKGHKARFEQLLDKKIPQNSIDRAPKKGVVLWIKAAAVILVAGLTAVWVFNNASAKANLNSTEFVNTVSDIKKSNDEPEVLLSAISPEFKRIEDFYLASVNLELARLEITDDNKELIDAFMQQLSELDAEYKRLNKEITESGVSEEMVNAMIENLKLRVQLMIKLKAKLKEIRDAEQQEASQQIV